MRYLAEWGISFSFRDKKKSVLVDGERLIFCTSHKRGTPSTICTALLRTVEQLLRILYSPSSVAVLNQMNPLPSFSLRCYLNKTANGVLYDRSTDITMAFSTFRELSKCSTALCAYLLCLMSSKPNNKCGM